jgi:hypothetical protein
LNSKRKAWTYNEVVYLVENTQRKLPREIACDLGRSVCSVRSFAWRHRVLTRNAYRRLLNDYKGE